MIHIIKRWEYFSHKFQLGFLPTAKTNNFPSILVTNGHLKICFKSRSFSIFPNKTETLLLFQFQPLETSYFNYSSQFLNYLLQCHEKYYISSSLFLHLLYT